MKGSDLLNSRSYLWVGQLYRCPLDTHIQGIQFT